MNGFFVPDPIALHARLRPSALVCRELSSGRLWTYAQFDMDIQRAVTVLSAEGIAPGDRVATLVHNRAGLIIMQQALMRIGAILAPLNWRLSLAEQAKLLKDCRPKRLYADRPEPKLPADCESRAMDDFEASVDAAVPAPRCPQHSAEDTAIILYTSGTSGVPKGAMLSGRFLLASAVNTAVLGEVSADSRFLCDSPMFHVIGIVAQIWPALLQGGAIVISSGFSAINTNDRLGDPDLGITHYFCVPQMAESLRHAENFDCIRWTRLKALFTAGAPNPPAHIKWWLENGVRMVDGFGMTETGTTLGMSLSAEVLRAKAGAVGLPGPLTSVRLVDSEGAEVDVDVPGEVLVYGANLCSGYWNRPEESTKAFTRDGWLRTGDIARRDADGFITIVDRSKDMFISGGENVYPVEVEAALAEHPAVREAAVIGVPDVRWGEVGRAYVVLSPDSSVSAENLAAHCAVRVARYKVPKEFVFVQALPRTGSGKVMKNLLRQETVKI